ncbi:hypothetical protein KY289_006308 [Solanum tuberosum]|nr:hypothetical protein KY289_006308 [Solanum tuberosum]
MPYLFWKEFYLPRFEFLQEITNHLPFKIGVREVKLKWESFYKGVLLQGLWIGARVEASELVCEGIRVRACYS